MVPCLPTPPVCGAPPALGPRLSWPTAPAPRSAQGAVGPCMCAPTQHSMPAVSSLPNCRLFMKLGICRRSIQQMLDTKIQGR